MARRQCGNCHILPSRGSSGIARSQEHVKIRSECCTETEECHVCSIMSYHDTVVLPSESICRSILVKMLQYWFRIRNTYYRIRNVTTKVKCLIGCDINQGTLSLRGEWKRLKVNWVFRHSLAQTVGLIQSEKIGFFFTGELRLPDLLRFLGLPRLPKCPSNN